MAGHRIITNEEGSLHWYWAVILLILAGWGIFVGAQRLDVFYQFATVESVGGNLAIVRLETTGKSYSVENPDLNLKVGTRVMTGFTDDSNVDLRGTDAATLRLFGIFKSAMNR